MRTFHRLTLTLAAALSLCAAPPAAACPNCKEAASSAIDEGDDPYREAIASDIKTHETWFGASSRYRNILDLNNKWQRE